MYLITIHMVYGMVYGMIYGMVYELCFPEHVNVASMVKLFLRPRLR